jgi:hypothetical protein
MEDFKTLFCPSKFPWTREIICSKYIDSLGTRPQKGSLALFEGVCTLFIKEAQRSKAVLTVGACRLK